MKHAPALFTVMSFAVACHADPVSDAPPVAVKGDLQIYHAYAPASPAPDVASLYFAVVNVGQLPDTLTAVHTNAGVAMLHDMVTEDGLSKMVHVPAIAIAPGDTLRLVPGSYHVMLSQLAQPLEVGDSIAVTLRFSQAGDLGFAAAVLTYTDVVERLEPEHRDP
jgi:copper(I)-binding protein